MLDSHKISSLNLDHRELLFPLVFTTKYSDHTLKPGAWIPETPVLQPAYFTLQLYYREFFRFLKSKF